MSAAPVAIALAITAPQASQAPEKPAAPELAALLADPTTEPSLSPEMLSVVTTCGVEQSRIHFSRGPEAVGFVIELTAGQAASPQLTHCLEAEIDNHYLRDRMWFVPPYPAAH